jgi:hypothetical protein
MPESTIADIAGLAHRLRRHFADDHGTLRGVLGSAWRNYAREAAQRLAAEAAGSATSR